MTKIRLLTSIVGAGPVSGAPDDELDVDDEVAAVWADGVRAERVGSSPPETAMSGPPETAAKARPKRR